MKDEGWSLGDLMGELMVLGIDINDVNDETLYRSLRYTNANTAAQSIEEEISTK